MQLTEQGTIMTMGACAQERIDGKKLQSMGKAWKPGEQGRVFYPVYRDPISGQVDIMVGIVWGHKVDLENFSRLATFIPSQAEVNEKGEVLRPDRLLQFSKLAPLFVEGMKEREKAELTKKDWSKLPGSALTKALEDVDKKYDRKNNLKAVKPVVGRREAVITTEVIYVKMQDDAAAMPFNENAGRYTQDLSDARIAKLRTLLNSKVYGPVFPDDDSPFGWLEVGYTFTSANGDKAEAGRCDPAGVSNELRLQNKPDIFEQVQALLEKLPKNSQSLMQHNYVYNPQEARDIEAAIGQYCVMHSDNLDFLTDEGKERLIKNAEIVSQLQIEVRDDELQYRLSQELDGAEVQTLSEQSNMPDMSAPVLQDMLKNATEFMNTAVEGADSVLGG